jgi:hypothetical protein
LTMEYGFTFFGLFFFTTLENYIPTMAVSVGYLKLIFT